MTLAEAGTTLSAGGTVAMVAGLTAALVALVFVLWRANRVHSDAHNLWAGTAHVTTPGLHTDAARRHAARAGDDPAVEDVVEPGGHVVRKHPD